MPNRNLTPEELNKARKLLDFIRERMKQLSEGDEALIFAYRRKIYKELSYDERGKPMQRKMLKLKKYAAQKGLCAECQHNLPEVDAVLDRFAAIEGYTVKNTRLLCRECDLKIQKSRGFA
jgi:hypothetical protein